MKTMLRPSRWAFFERRPAMPLAPNDLRLVALQGAFLWLLAGKAQPT
ncbi:hypothetical protein [Verminephrobacter eiseniae]|nr:hypothetical protein [Verminephrobacter eiseniae]